MMASMVAVQQWSKTWRGVAVWGSAARRVPWPWTSLQVWRVIEYKDEWMDSTALSVLADASFLFTASLM
jgi:hypothetical protein